MLKFNGSPESNKLELIPTTPEKSVDVEKIIKQKPLSPQQKLDNLETKIKNNAMEISELTEHVDGTKKELDEIREELGLPATEESPPSTLSEEERLEVLQAEQERLKGELGEVGNGKKNNAEGNENEPDKKKTEEGGESGKNEKELREKREQAVDAWIEAAKQFVEINEENKTFHPWEETENGEKSKEVLISKIGPVIKESPKVKSYLETGKPKGLNLKYKIKSASYEFENIDKKKVVNRYITGIDLKVSLGVNDQDPYEEIRQELFSEQQEKALENAQKIEEHKELKRGSAYFLP